MIHYQSPRMKMKIERWSEQHLTVVEFRRKKDGDWLLVHGLWSHARYPSDWLPKLKEYKERILIDAEKGQELLEHVLYREPERGN